VVGGRHHPPLVGALTASVSRRLVRTAPCPVLVVTPDTTRETFRAVTRQQPAAA
jgi:hypothetical protein